MHRVRVSVAVVAMAVVTLTALCAAQTPIDELTIFEPFVGTSWIGRFQDRTVIQADHLIDWTTLLDGQAVRWSKRVEELGFTMETTFSWDREREAIAFTQLASNGNHGEGTAAAEGCLLVLVGVSRQASGALEFRQTFEIMDDGALEDRYYRRAGDGWSPSHVIVYHRLQETEE